MRPADSGQTWRDLKKGDRVSHFDYGDGTVDASGPAWIYITWDDPAERVRHHDKLIAQYLTRI